MHINSQQNIYFQAYSQAFLKRYLATQLIHRTGTFSQWLISNALRSSIYAVSKKFLREWGNQDKKNILRDYINTLNRKREIRSFFQNKAWKKLFSSYEKKLTYCVCYLNRIKKEFLLSSRFLNKSIPLRLSLIIRGSLIFYTRTFSSSTKQVFNRIAKIWFKIFYSSCITISVINKSLGSLIIISNCSSINFQDCFFMFLAKNRNLRQFLGNFFKYLVILKSNCKGYKKNLWLSACRKFQYKSFRMLLSRKMTFKYRGKRIRWFSFATAWGWRRAKSLSLVYMNEFRQAQESYIQYVRQLSDFMNCFVTDINGLPQFNFFYAFQQIRRNVFVRVLPSFGLMKGRYLLTSQDSFLGAGHQGSFLVNNLKGLDLRKQHNTSIKHKLLIVLKKTKHNFFVSLHNSSKLIAKKQMSGLMFPGDARGKRKSLGLTKILLRKLLTRRLLRKYLRGIYTLSVKFFNNNKIFQEGLVLEEIRRLCRFRRKGEVFGIRFHVSSAIIGRLPAIGGVRKCRKRRQRRRKRRKVKKVERGDQIDTERIRQFIFV